jgi:hypothetical protein
MFPIESFRDTLLKMAKVLRQHAIPFDLTGGITGVAYGEPQLTQDLDIGIENEATSDQFDLLCDSSYNSDFIFDRDAIKQAVLDKNMFRLFDSVEALKLWTV